MKSSYGVITQNLRNCFHVLFSPVKGVLPLFRFINVDVCFVCFLLVQHVSACRLVHYDILLEFHFSLVFVNFKLHMIYHNHNRKLENRNVTKKNTGYKSWFRAAFTVRSFPANVGHSAMGFFALDMSA